MTINEIRLHGVLPDVFVGDSRDKGDIWLADMAFRRGKFYLVEAESGAGKSSLCSFIYGNRSDYQGKISFDGRDIRSLSVSEWCAVRSRSIALLPQEMRIFPELTARENVEIKNNLTGCCTRARIEEMFGLLGIADRIDTPAGRLSVGQQQRVAIIRTLCQPADFIVLDEPVSHLDERNNAVAARLIEEHARALGAAVISTSVGNHLAVQYDSVLKLSAKS